MSFVVDTNTCSAYIRGNPLVYNRFLQYSGQLYISVVTLGELTIWSSRAKAPPKRAKQVHDLLTSVNIIDVNADIGRKFGEVQASLLDRGKPAPPLDLLIAATALVHGYTVVSHNTADFQNVPGLTVVDWLAP
jgi:tRNA(fMet)-specific endonuclease VapC